MTECPISHGDGACAHHADVALRAAQRDVAQNVGQDRSTPELHPTRTPSEVLTPLSQTECFRFRLSLFPLLAMCPQPTLWPNRPGWLIRFQGHKGFHRPSDPLGIWKSCSGPDRPPGVLGLPVPASLRSHRGRLFSWWRDTHSAKICPHRGA